MILNKSSRHSYCSPPKLAFKLIISLKECHSLQVVVSKNLLRAYDNFTPIAGEVATYMLANSICLIYCMIQWPTQEDWGGQQSVQEY